MPEEKNGEPQVVPGENSEESLEKGSENEGLLKELQRTRDKLQEIEEQNEMLEEKLELLNTSPPPDVTENSEEDEDYATIKRVRKIAEEAAKTASSETFLKIRVGQVADILNRSEYGADFEKYLVPMINKKKSLVTRLITSDDPVEEALSMLERSPGYRKSKEKQRNLDDSNKIKDNLNKPKNFSEVSGGSVGKKMPKDMTAEEVFKEQEEILNE
jgi:hypothetical protein